MERDSAPATKVRVCAVIVCFEPTLATLQRLVASVLPEVQAVAVVNNGSSASVRAWLDGKESASTLAHIDPGANVGVAAAHNLGIDFGRRCGCTHVLLMDQDSIAPAGMVARLAQTLVALQARGIRVAAVGPQPFDARKQAPMPLVRLGLLSNRADLANERPGEAVAVDMLISSGMLIPLAVVDAVGPMAEKLFIDYVDVEWCFRALHHGYTVYADPGLRMPHRLGETSQRVWCLGWRNVFVHKPFRLYYIMRNRILLHRMAHAPRRWKVPEWYRIPVTLVLFGLLIPPRLENLLMMMRGLSDGLYSLARAGHVVRPPIEWSLDQSAPQITQSKSTATHVVPPSDQDATGG